MAFPSLMTREVGGHGHCCSLDWMAAIKEVVTLGRFWGGSQPLHDLRGRPATCSGGDTSLAGEVVCEHRVAGGHGSLGRRLGHDHHCRCLGRPYRASQVSLPQGHPPPRGTSEALQLSPSPPGTLNTHHGCVKPRPRHEH